MNGRMGRRRSPEFGGLVAVAAIVSWTADHDHRRDRRGRLVRCRCPAQPDHALPEPAYASYSRRMLPNWKELRMTFLSLCFDAVPQIVRVLLVASGVGGFAVAAQAQSAQDFFANRQLNLFVGSIAGSGYDAYAHLVAKYMEKHLPAGVHIVIHDMPGAEGLAATNYVVNVADKDGASFAVVPREAIMDPLLSPAKVTQARFDPLKLIWFGSPNQEMGMVYLSTRSGATSIEDARKKPYLIAASGSNSGSAVLGRILNTMIGTKFKIVHGYTGSADALLAVENGEADGRITSGWAGPERIKVSQWVQTGKVRLLMQISAKKSPDYPDVPYLMDYLQGEADKRVAEYLLTSQLIGNPFFAAPGIPQDRAALLKDAFWKTVNDPDFVADAKAQLLVVGPIGADELKRIVERAYSTPPELRQRARAIYDSAQN